jgi:hypothetical protein
VETQQRSLVMEKVKVAVERRDGDTMDVHLTVPLASVPRIAAAVAAIPEADCLTASDLWQLPGGACITDFCFSYAGAWWLTGEFMYGPHAYTGFNIALDGESNVKISLNILRASDGLDYTKTVDPNLWWVDVAAVFKQLLNSGL